MDEVRLEELSSEHSMEESISVDEYMTEYSSSDDENLAEKNSSSDENMTKSSSSDDENLAEEKSSSDESMTECSSSDDENLAEDSSSSEENCAKKYGSGEENVLSKYDSAEESSSDEENGFKKYSSGEKNNSDKKNWLKKCVSSEGTSSDEENWLRKYNSAEENSSDEENSIRKFSSDKENSSEEENVARKNRSAPGNSSDDLVNLAIKRKLMKDFIEEHGLIFEAASVNAAVCVVEIVIVGKDKNVKTQLIESVFGDHPSFSVENLDDRDEYRILLFENVYIHIWIHDLKDAEYARKQNFRNKTVILFCFATDDLESLVDLEEIWIPAIFRSFSKTLACFLVGLERNPETKPKSTNGTIGQELKMAIEEKASELCLRLVNGRQIRCSMEAKSSMLKVFQSAIDTVYPWTCFS